jgi:hypothetical protein
MRPPPSVVLGQQSGARVPIFKVCRSVASVYQVAIGLCVMVRLSIPLVWICEALEQCFDLSRHGCMRRPGLRDGTRRMEKVPRGVDTVDLR